MIPFISSKSSIIVFKQYSQHKVFITVVYFLSCFMSCLSNAIIEGIFSIFKYNNISLFNNFNEIAEESYSTYILSSLAFTWAVFISPIVYK